MEPETLPTSPPAPAANPRRTRHFWFGVGLLAVGFNLWLTGAQQLAVVSWAIHDEIFFLSRAHDREMIRDWRLAMIAAYVSPIQALLPAFVVLSLAPAIHWARNRRSTSRLKTDSAGRGCRRAK